MERGQEEGLVKTVMQVDSDSACSNVARGAATAAAAAAGAYGARCACGA